MVRNPTEPLATYELQGSIQRIEPTDETPFTLSLSKGGWPSRSCFDELSTNGLIVEEYVFSIMDSLVIVK
jgi:hypothetical protein